MPDINYVSQTASSVSVAYADMPAATEVVYVNTTSGAKTPSGSPALNNGGSGKAAIPIDTHLASGQYYLLAQGQANKQYIAQTVAFYINRPPAGLWARLLSFFGFGPRAG